MGNVSDVGIRFAQPSDRDQLLGLRQALWPKSSAEEHMLELTVILEGKAPGTMPLIILVAEGTIRHFTGQSLAMGGGRRLGAQPRVC